MKASESHYRGSGENRRGPRSPLILAEQPPKLDSSGPLQRQHLFQVVAHPFEPEVMVIPHLT